MKIIDIIIIIILGTWALFSLIYVINSIIHHRSLSCGLCDKDCTSCSKKLKEDLMKARNAEKEKRN